MIELETERLRLRQFRREDVEDYAAICADPEVMRFVGGGQPLSRLESWRHLALFLGHWQLRGYGMWALEEKASGQLLGRVGFIHPEGWPGCELAWTLRRASWGKGFASEGAKAALAYGFASVGLPRVISLIHPANHRSVRVAEGLGEKYEGGLEWGGQEVLLYGIENMAKTG